MTNFEIIWTSSPNMKKHSLPDKYKTEFSVLGIRPQDTVIIILISWLQ